jgi:hypothetical protein
VTPLCGAVSSNNFGEVIWKPKMGWKVKKPRSRRAIPEESPSIPLFQKGKVSFSLKGDNAIFMTVYGVINFYYSLSL